jgi:hypothetical protein
VEKERHCAKSNPVFDAVLCLAVAWEFADHFSFACFGARSMLARGSTETPGSAFEAESAFKKLDAVHTFSGHAEAVNPP